MKALLHHLGWSKGLALAALILLFLFSGLGGYDLSAPDEPRFALVAREMIEDNHWLLPHRNGNAYPDKPPLYFWSIAAISALNGGDVNALTARLPSALAGFLVLWMMVGFARNPQDDDDLMRPLLTLLVLMSSFRFFFQAHMAQIDMTLCALTTAAMVLGYEVITGARQSQRGLGLLMGLGILAKGPVGYLIPAGALAVFAFFKGRDAWRRYPKRALLWGLVPPLLWLGGLLIEVAIANEWAYLENLLFKQTVVRYLNPWHHYRPFYYFLEVLLYDFQPWIFVLLGAIPFRRKIREALNDKQRFAWAVVLFTLCFFSLSKGKRNLYIVPLYPFAAYLVATQLHLWIAEMTQPKGRRLSLAAPSLILAMVGLGLAAVGLGMANDRLPGYILTTPPEAPLILSGFAIVLSSVCGMLAILKGKLLHGVASLVTTMAVVCSTLYLVILPWVGPYRSARNLTVTINDVVKAQSPQPLLGMVWYRSAYRFYGDIPLIELSSEDRGPAGKPKLAEFWEAHPDAWVLIRKKHLKTFQEKDDRELTIHLERRVGRGEHFLLISQRH